MSARLGMQMQPVPGYEGWVVFKDQHQAGLFADAMHGDWLSTHQGLTTPIALKSADRCFFATEIATGTVICLRMVSRVMGLR